MHETPHSSLTQVINDKTWEVVVTLYNMYVANVLKWCQTCFLGPTSSWKWSQRKGRRFREGSHIWYAGKIMTHRVCIEHVSRFYFVIIHFFVHLTQNNIEIENKEEADFLKSKLCDLLKEFKAKKSLKAEVSLTLKVKFCNEPPLLIFSQVAKYKQINNHLFICCRKTQVEHPSPKTSTPLIQITVCLPDIYMSGGSEKRLTTANK